MNRGGYPFESGFKMLTLYIGTVQRGFKKLTNLKVKLALTIVYNFVLTNH